MKTGGATAGFIRGSVSQTVSQAPLLSNACSAPKRSATARGEKMPDDILVKLALDSQEHIRTRPRSVPQIGQQ